MSEDTIHHEHHTHYRRHRSTLAEQAERCLFIVLLTIIGLWTANLGLVYVAPMPTEEILPSMSGKEIPYYSVQPLVGLKVDHVGVGYTEADAICQARDAIRMEMWVTLVSFVLACLSLIYFRRSPLWRRLMMFAAFVMILYAFVM